MKLCRENCFPSRQRMPCASAIVISVAGSLYSEAQDGNAGLNEANTEVRSYFMAGTNLMYAVLAHGSEQHFVTVVFAMKTLPQCSHTFFIRRLLLICPFMSSKSN